jgi:hypothetical protein
VPGLESSAPFKINIDVDRNEFEFDYENSGCTGTKFDNSEIVS